MKVFILLAVLAICFAKELRLIEFNETTRRWVPRHKVDELAQECGKDHGGFFDITDHRNLSPNGLDESVQQRIAAFSYPNEPTHQTVVNSLIAMISKTKMREYNDKLSSYFTRYYSTDTGKQAAEWIHSEFEKGKASHPDVQVEFFSHSWKQPSVIARIEGKGDYADELVIIGAHEDSINGGANGRSPGADDDASGTSSVLEVFRILVEAGFQPDRTIEFHTYAAEEVGLLGSQDIASKYQKDKKVVYSMMQLDMTFYTKSGTTPQFGIVTDYVNADLTAFLRKLVSAYSTLKSVDTKCGYGCSDHASWTKAGFQACFPFETTFANSNKNIHSTQDLIDKLDLNHGAEFVKVALGYLVELSLAK